MRCTKARKVMIASFDGAVRDDERQDLDDHLAGCAACRREHDEARRLTLALAGLGEEATVPPSLEDAVVRRVRNLDADRPVLGERLRGWFPTPVLLAGAAVAAALLVVDATERSGGSFEAQRIAAPRPVEAPATRVAVAGSPADEAGSGNLGDDGAPVRVADAALVPPSEPPPDLTASLPLLLDMPILRNMEKLENFERIEALTLADDEESNG